MSKKQIYAKVFLLETLRDLIVSIPRHNNEPVFRWTSTYVLQKKLRIKTCNEVLKEYNKLVDAGYLVKKRASGSSSNLYSFKSYEDFLFIKRIVITEKKQRWFQINGNHFIKVEN